MVSERHFAQASPVDSRGERKELVRVSQAASFDTKQRVKQAVDIVDLVNTYLPLRREGRGYKALCPWHDDSRPSLQVNPDRQSFKCWVCDIGGDIFSFVMKMEGVGFPEALAMLADRANISLEPASRRAVDAADDKRLLYQAMAWADQQYHACLLNDPAAEPARQYLMDRRISDASVRKFQLGFAPDQWSWLVEQARGTPYSTTMLERVGLVARRKNSPGHYDRFKGRVLFPIFDTQARAVGLGGRVLPGAPADQAKYYNSTETPLFSKSHTLYGLNLAREAIRKTGTAIVMEGYTDCIVAHQCGFDNAVAVLGTALGASHIQLLRRFADRVRVVLVLDGDEAGRKRAKEVLELFVAANVDLRVLTLPDELDPADYLLDHGPEALERLVAGASDALTHAFRSATAGIDLQADLHAATQALEQLAGTIAKAPRLRSDTQVEDRLREEKFLQRLSVDFRVPEERVRELVTQMRRKTSQRAESREASDASVEKIDPLERELLEVLLQSPQAIERVARVIQAAQLVSRNCRFVLSVCNRLWSEGVLPDFNRLLLEIDDPGVKNLLVELDEVGRQKGEAEFEVRLQDVLDAFSARQRDQGISGRTAALKQRQLTPEDELAALVDLVEHERAKQHAKEERARLGSSEPTEG